MQEQRGFYGRAILLLVVIGLPFLLPPTTSAQEAGCSGTGTPASLTSGFLDVPSNHWAKGCIEKVATAGIMPGCGGSFFCPEAHVLREEMAFHILKGEHLGENPPFVPPAATGTTFTDAPAGYCLSPWIEQFYRDGFTSGCDVGLYCSYKTLTRAEMAVFLVRAYHGGSFVPPAATGTYFADVPITHWAAKFIEQLFRDGITAGCSSNPNGSLNYCPESTVTRAEMAVFLTRVYGVGGGTCQ